MAEHDRHWSPLNESVTAQEAAHLAWRQESGSILSYQHTEIGRHIYIDAEAVVSSGARLILTVGVQC